MTTAPQGALAQQNTIRVVTAVKILNLTNRHSILFPVMARIENKAVPGYSISETETFCGGTLSEFQTPPCFLDH